MRIPASIIVFGILLMPLVLSAADAKAGEAIFSTRCKACHGADGSGNPAIAKMMKVDMKALGSQDVQKNTDAQLKTIILNGTGKMKPITIAGADADNVIAYIRTLKK